jgi:hypothetical protein
MPVSMFSRNVIMCGKRQNYACAPRIFNHGTSGSDEELHNLYSLPNRIKMIKSRRMRWAGHVARMGETRNIYRILVGKPEGKRPLGRPRRRWVDDIKMDLRGIGWDGVVWTGWNWLRIGTSGGLL